MALRLYLRRRSECEAGFAEDFKSGKFEGSRRGKVDPVTWLACYSWRSSVRPRDLPQ